MKTKKIYHLNDRTAKYLASAQTRRLHQYLKLPGEFKKRYPQEFVFPNMGSGRMDELYSTNEDLLINLEEESKKITAKTKSKFGKYVIFCAFMYSRKIYLGVICHQKPPKEFEYYQISPSLCIKIHYFHFEQEELWEKYENIINKVKQKENLTDMEALDIAFISKFISREYAPYILESLAEIFEEAIIDDLRLKMDVAIIFGGMILKQIQDIEKQNKLLEMINMRQYETDMEELVYDEYGDILNEKDKEIESKTQEIESKTREIEKLNNENKEYKEKIRQLNEIEDLNTPQAKKILNSLMLL